MLVQIHADQNHRKLSSNVEELLTGCCVEPNHDVVVEGVKMVDAGELAVTTADNTHRALTWNIQTSKFCTYKQRCGAGTFLPEPGHFCRSRDIFAGAGTFLPEPGHFLLEPV